MSLAGQASKSPRNAGRSSKRKNSNKESHHLYRDCSAAAGTGSPETQIRRSSRRMKKQTNRNSRRKHRLSHKRMRASSRSTRPRSFTRWMKDSRTPTLMLCTEYKPKTKRNKKRTMVRTIQMLSFPFRILMSRRMQWNSFKWSRRVTREACCLSWFRRCCSNLPRSPSRKERKPPFRFWRMFSCLNSKNTCQSKNSNVSNSNWNKWAIKQV